jgi:hypothetical protein
VRELNGSSRSGTATIKGSQSSIVIGSIPFVGNPPLSAPCKGAEILRVQVPPGNWVAPAGSNRSGSGGNETAEAFGARGRFGRPCEQAGRNMRER